MIAALDVQYHQTQARVAAILFTNWTDTTPTRIYTLELEHVAPYESGAFYKRELPCLLAILETIIEQVNCIVVDGYVYLDSQHKFGLGAHLYTALEEKTPIIGVAKTEFVGAPSIGIVRGQSKQPLFISSIGMDLQIAAQWVQQMDGVHRLPTLLKAVDHAARGIRLKS